MTIYELPIWLFILFVTLLCFSLSIYLTCQHKKAATQVIVKQRQRMPQQKALIFEAHRLPRLPSFAFCPVCGKQAGISNNADVCGFCGQSMVPHSRRQTRRFFTRDIGVVQ